MHTILNLVNSVQCVCGLHDYNVLLLNSKHPC